MFPSFFFLSFPFHIVFSFFSFFLLFSFSSFFFLFFFSSLIIIIIIYIFFISFLFYFFFFFSVFFFYFFCIQTKLGSDIVGILFGSCCLYLELVGWGFCWQCVVNVVLIMIWSFRAKKTHDKSLKLGTMYGHW